MDGRREDSSADWQTRCYNERRGNLSAESRCRPVTERAGDLSSVGADWAARGLAAKQKLNGLMTSARRARRIQCLLPRQPGAAAPRYILEDLFAGRPYSIVRATRLCWRRPPAGGRGEQTVVNQRPSISPSRRTSGQAGVRYSETRRDVCVHSNYCRPRVRGPAVMAVTRVIGATVAERLAHSPPTKANRSQSQAGSPDFRKRESCRTMPLVGGSSRGSLVSPTPSFRCCSIFSSITRIGFQDLAVRKCNRSGDPLVKAAANRPSFQVPGMSRRNETGLIITPFTAVTTPHHERRRLQFTDSSTCEIWVARRTVGVWEFSCRHFPCELRVICSIVDLARERHSPFTGLDGPINFSKCDSLARVLPRKDAQLAKMSSLQYAVAFDMPFSP
ncbi:hypothetical protein PR048_014560 [Dryococelus australis]|uniref:Uncharacterized protein n=1 Tax=Dryococelus australis TaxID=614101 RepID=A0ABQ9HEK3_9NEOP|nr:hypothetical protein PR048_014560 [Dryococelus australis]